MEERRAVLGCYLITASIALTTSKIDALRWTPHMEESLSALTNARECPEDERLVTLVKLSLVMDKAYHLQRDGDGHHAPYFYIKAFQSQLNLVKDSIPGSLRNDDSILFHIATTELVIHEIAMRAPSTPNTPDLQRLDSLYTSLQAAKTWLDLWLSQRPTEYMAFPYTIFGQLSRALVSLYRLSVLDDPAWDRNFVRTTANLLEYLNRMTYGMKMSTTHLAVPHQSEWNVFEKASTMFQCIREGWEPKLIEAWFPSPQSRGFDDTLNASNPPMLDETLPMNGLDDLWMMDVFGSL
ncbi:hypothetical protein N7539_007549 [Penicillium diatomitis]|uniref:Uncharacterized protein n=1 Tax=Penicillium diatomitis TaxID=2819901 RepID=A0A9W9WVB7_9EURO|nr:uncharacterized protein N7539_007549 [Penicillium diatomitis]KAJ5477405.1 hypothetical protein N7539_007549 [Penicillium diatomitis]